MASSAGSVLAKRAPGALSGVSTSALAHPLDLAEVVGLTTIRQPLREGGALAADLLLAAIEHGMVDPVEECQELCGVERRRV